MSDSKRWSGVGQVARRSGLTPRALRYYEARGVLVPERAANGYRRYGAQHLRLAVAVAQLRGAGVPLETIRTIVAIKSAGIPLDRKVGRILSVLDRIEEDLRARRAQLAGALKQLQGFRRQCRCVLAGASGPTPGRRTVGR